jgi:hypothetical protein
MLLRVEYFITAAYIAHIRLQKPGQVNVYEAVDKLTVLLRLYLRPNLMLNTQGLHLTSG